MLIHYLSAISNYYHEYVLVSQNNVSHFQCSYEKTTKIPSFIEEQPEVKNYELTTPKRK